MNIILITKPPQTLPSMRHYHQSRPEASWARPRMTWWCQRRTSGTPPSNPLVIGLESSRPGLVGRHDTRLRSLQCMRTDTGHIVDTGRGTLFSCDWSKREHYPIQPTAKNVEHKIGQLPSSHSRCRWQDITLARLSGQALAFAAHNKPVRNVRFVDDVPGGSSAPIVASTS